MAEPQSSTRSARKGSSGNAGKTTEQAAPPQTYKFRELLPPNLNIDFVGKRYFFLGLSTVLNILSLGLLFTWGLNFGVDFRGGTDLRLRVAEPTTAAALRSDLESMNLRDLSVQDFGVQGKEFLLRFDVEEGEQMSSIADVLRNTLQAAHPQAGPVELLSVESVGPRVGADLRRQGFLAVAFATIFMGIYIALRFEWSFGLGAVIALIHDVLITVGVLIVTRMAFDLTTLAALLTVVGFSVHDTIIVSDRIRETLRRNPKLDLAQAINRSINETLSRTLLTTGTALFVLLALLLLGGDILRPFAVTLLVGFITGTYSTIYIAAPIVLLWANRSKIAG